MLILFQAAWDFYLPWYAAKTPGFGFIFNTSGKAEILNAFFTSIFSEKALPQISHTLEVSERVWGMGDFPLVRKEDVREHQSSTKVHNPTRT